MGKSPHRVVSRELKARLKRLASAATVRRAAVAYVTSDEVQFREGDSLVVDASNRAIACGETDARVLRKAFDRGANLYSLTDLHAKLLVFDDTAVIGSANLSGSELIEAAVITTDHVIVSGVASLIAEMSRAAQVIDDRFLCRIEQIEVKRSPRRTRAARTFADRGSRTWLVSVSEVAPDDFPDEEQQVEQGTKKAQRLLKGKRSEVSWVRFTGNSRFRRTARAGDAVIRIWKARGSKRPRALAHSPILWVQRELNWTRFYVESSPREDELSLSWTQYTRLARACGLTNISKGACREIDAEIAESLRSHWRSRKRK